MSTASSPEEPVNLSDDSKFGTIAPTCAADHPTRSTSRLFKEDLLLRKHHFRIHSRPRKGPTLWVWSLTGELYNQQRALEYIRDTFINKVKEEADPITTTATEPAPAKAKGRGKNKEAG
jgi:hypothetical protein